MISKYDRQRQRLDDSIREGLRRNEDKSTLLQKLKQKKIVVHYMNQCRKRINQVMEKQYAVEQLNLTAMQIAALQETASVFQTFNKKHNIEKRPHVGNMRMMGGQPNAAKVDTQMSDSGVQKTEIPPMEL